MTEPEIRRTMSFDYVLPSEAARDAFEDEAFDWFHDAAEEAGGQCDGASAGPFEDEPEGAELETLRGIAKRLADGWALCVNQPLAHEWEDLDGRVEPMTEAEVHAIYGTEREERDENAHQEAQKEGMEDDD